MVKCNTLLTIAGICAVSAGQAAISQDRTRIIYNGDEKSVALNIANENEQQPYLAQSWLENDRHEKITTGPLVVTQPVQCLEPGAKSQLRLMATPGVSQLPQDRESLFYFNLREIPPKSDKANVLQIALQTQVKLYWRPEAIKAEPNKAWQDQLILHPEAGGYRISNSTPYYITITGLGVTRNDAEEGGFEAVMVAPKSEQSVKAPQIKTPWLTFINDYGGRSTLPFRCAGSQCTSGEKA